MNTLYGSTYDFKEVKNDLYKYKINILLNSLTNKENH